MDCNEEEIEVINKTSEEAGLLTTWGLLLLSKLRTVPTTRGWMEDCFQTWFVLNVLLSGGMVTLPRITVVT